MNRHNGQGNCGGQRMRLRRARTVLQWFKFLCCGARLAPLTFPLIPFLSLCGRAKGNAGDRSERILATPHPMVVQARYVPDEKAEFLSRILMRWYHLS
jgi:hypothetical protein